MIGTWATTNCAAPALQNISSSTFQIFTTAVAAGAVIAGNPAAGGFDLAAEL
jgi:hypothetical protein